MNLWSPSRRSLLADASLLALSALPGMAWAQAEGRALRVILPYAAGSGADVVFRPYIDAMGRYLHQPLFIDNRGGANGLIGMEVASKAAPDGYTVALGTSGTMVINRFLYSKLPYDPTRDYELVGTAFGTANVLTARKGLEANTVAELVAHAKRNPGKLKVASGGVGSTGHLSAALFDAMAGTQIVHVPYKSGVDAYKDMVNGDIDLLYENVALTANFNKGGRIKAIAATSLTRVPTLPDLPTFDESGLKGFEILAWVGLIAPKGTPAPVLDRLGAALRKAVEDPEVKAATESFALIPMSGSAQQFAELIRKETPKWADLVKRSGAKLD